mgnify:CR=1 FL=1
MAHLYTKKVCLVSEKQRLLIILSGQKLATRLALAFARRKRQISRSAFPRARRSPGRLSAVEIPRRSARPCRRRRAPSPFPSRPPWPTQTVSARAQGHRDAAPWPHGLERPPLGGKVSDICDRVAKCVRWRRRSSLRFRKATASGVSSIEISGCSSDDSPSSTTTGRDATGISTVRRSCLERPPCHLPKWCS